ncbi:hypothetical protein OO184_03480 [Photorhabdus sp. APURE]|uniref:hypothetical protein n=1 Tax=Photorhabdus aballayi TaxID=2991723 RepID=UPI00223E2189|nr:hypothetical protein [Photorhabdus aballayi]MCW7547030.1 hypothetical protein [Photorhabdus aballayi]
MKKYLGANVNGVFSADYHSQATWPRRLTYWIEAGCSTLQKWVALYCIKKTMVETL